MPSRPAALEDVREEVEEAVVRDKKKAVVLDRLRALRDRLDREGWEKLDGKDGLEYKTVNEHKRQQYLSGIGDSEEVDQLAFSLPLNAVSEPVAFEKGALLLRVLDRKQITPEEFSAKEKEARASLLENKKNLFLGSYLAKLFKDKNVKVEYNNFLQVVSGVLSRYEAAEED